MSNNSQIDAFLDQINIPQVTDKQNAKLVSKITKEEIQLAIRKMKGGKSPGTDGYTTEWYKTMQDQLITILLKTFNWILENKTNSFILERGTRQGCCAWPLLFALFIEPLSQLIRQRPDIKEVSMASGEQKLSVC